MRVRTSCAARLVARRSRNTRKKYACSMYSSRSRMVPPMKSSYRLVPSATTGAGGLPRLEKEVEDDLNRSDRVALAALSAVGEVGGKADQFFQLQPHVMCVRRPASRLLQQLRRAAGVFLHTHRLTLPHLHSRGRQLDQALQERAHVPAPAAGVP